MAEGRVICVIDERVDWEAGLRGAFWGPFIAAHTLGEVTMRCSDSMVDNVAAALAPNERISALRIVDHAYHHGIELGDDWVTPGSFTRFARSLRRLAPYFARGGFAHFVGCHAGNAPMLLHRFAETWGVCVYGGLGETNGWAYNRGGWVRVRPCGRIERRLPWPKPDHP